MKHLMLCLALTTMTWTATQAVAGELDPTPAPKGILVKVNANDANDQTVYRADFAKPVQNDQDAQVAIATFGTQDNILGKAKAATSELDQTSSHEEWRYWYSPGYHHNWGGYPSYAYPTYNYYGCNWYGNYNYYYNPYAYNSYYYGGYNYYYYYWWYRY